MTKWQLIKRVKRGFRQEEFTELELVPLSQQIVFYKPTSYYPKYTAEFERYDRKQRRYFFREEIAQTTDLESLIEKVFNKDDYEYLITNLGE